MGVSMFLDVVSCCKLLKHLVRYGRLHVVVYCLEDVAFCCVVGSCWKYLLMV